MSEITRVGADLAKRVIQVHAVDASGKLVTNRALPRDKFVTWCAQRMRPAPTTLAPNTPLLYQPAAAALTVAAGFPRVGSSSSMRLLDCVGRRFSASVR